MAEKTVKLEDPANNRMGSAKMLPLILTMALPAMFSMLIQALYNIVDSYFVAQVSQNALTAVSLAFPIQNLLVAFGVGTGVGVSSLISRRLGERDQEAADNAATHAEPGHGRDEADRDRGQQQKGIRCALHGAEREPVLQRRFGLHQVV